MGLIWGGEYLFDATPPVVEAPPFPVVERPKPQKPRDEDWDKKPETPPVTQQKPPRLRRTGFAARMASLAGVRRYVVLSFRQTVCPACNKFENNVANKSDWSKKVRSADAAFDVINVDTDQEAGQHFEVHRTPWGAIWDTRIDKWHPLPFDGNDTPPTAFAKVQQGIDALNAPEGK